MEVAKLDGINIHYKIHGDAQKVILLIGGVASDHKMWSYVIPPLVKYYKVIVFDNRGIGLTTDNNEPFSISTMAQDCYHLLNYLKIDKAHIIGHSMGGMIAQQFAISYPNNTHKLVILNSASYAHKTLEFALSNQNFVRSQHVLEPTAILQLFIPWLFSSQFLNSKKNITAFIEGYLNEPNKQSITDYQRQLNALLNADLRKDIEQITHKTLIVASNEDLLTIPYYSIEMAKHIKNSQLVTLPGGHLSQIEYPDLLAQNILKFLLIE